MSSTLCSPLLSRRDLACSNQTALVLLLLWLKALVLAVMPRDSSNGVDEANAFLAHVQATYPDTADHWQALDSEEEFVAIMAEEDYASEGAAPGFSFGIVFSSGSPDWEYKVSAASTTMFSCFGFILLLLPRVASSGIMRAYRGMFALRQEYVLSVLSCCRAVCCVFIVFEQF